MTVQPRGVIVSRPTQMDEILGRHGTRGQAQFYLSQRGQSLEELEYRHELQAVAMQEVDRQIPANYRQTRIDRRDLDRWMFEPEDIVVVVGQDGLVANVAKYLDGQFVIGINPDPDSVAGVLARHHGRDLGELLQGSQRSSIERRTMVQATLDDGRSIMALNEVFVGVETHQSARYRVQVATAAEQQSSSGIVVGTGTGATGWCASLWNDRLPAWHLPTPTSTELAWFVREAWPSPSTGTELTEGLLSEETELTIVSASDSLVVFGDGIETDRLDVGWGQTITIGRAIKTLHLVI